MVNRSEIMNKVAQIFRDIFDDEELIINDNTCADDIDDWDSIEHINLILAVEKEFSIKFDMNEIARLKSVGEIVRAIESKLQ
mgnify:FL=1